MPLQFTFIFFLTYYKNKAFSALATRPLVYVGATPTIVYAGATDFYAGATLRLSCIYSTLKPSLNAHSIYTYVP